VSTDTPGSPMIAACSRQQRSRRRGEYWLAAVRVFGEPWRMTRTRCLTRVPQRQRCALRDGRRVDPCENFARAYLLANRRGEYGVRCRMLAWASRRQRWPSPACCLPRRCLVSDVVSGLLAKLDELSQLEANEGARRWAARSCGRGRTSRSTMDALAVRVADPDSMSCGCVGHTETIDREPVRLDEMFRSDRRRDARAWAEASCPA
jgi:hypothetical protein